MRYKILFLLNPNKDSERKPIMLLDNGADIYYTESIEEGIYQLSLFPYHLVILEIIQDIAFTLKVIQNMRLMSKNPILVLEPAYLDGKRELILSGADSVIKDNCSSELLSLETYALMRRFEEWKVPQTEKVEYIQWEQLVMERAYYKAFWRQKELNFSRHEFEFLYLLSATPGRVYSFEQIHQNVWRDCSHGDIRNIIWCLIRRVRKKLDSVEEGAGNIVKSVRDIGYYIELSKVGCE